MRNQSGMALLETILGAVLVAVVIAGVGTWYVSENRAVLVLQAEGARVDVTRYVRQVLHCGNTFANTVADPAKVVECQAADEPSARYIEVRDPSNIPVIARYTADADAQKVGTHLVRARCVSQGSFHGVVVETKKIGTDPRTGLEDTWHFINNRIPLCCP
jgi:type II secretory pathway pseudopilin PulG